MKRKILAVLLGAVILFIWNAVSWMALPFHSSTLNTMPDEVIAVMDQSMPPDVGVYHYPGLDSENVMEKLEKGPRVPLMVYRPGPSSFFDPMIFTTSFLYNLILAVLILKVLSMMKDCSFKSVLTISVILGLIVGFASDIPQMNWYLFPLDYTIINVVDYVVGISLVSLFMNKLLINGTHSS